MPRPITALARRLSIVRLWRQVNRLENFRPNFFRTIFFSEARSAGGRLSPGDDTRSYVLNQAIFGMKRHAQHFGEAQPESEIIGIDDEPLHPEAV